MRGWCRISAQRTCWQHLIPSTTKFSLAISEVSLAQMAQPLAGYVRICQTGSSFSNLARNTSPRVGLNGFLRSYNMQFDSHASIVATACNYHTRALHHVHSLLTDEASQILACSTVASWINYCNALLHGVPVKTFNKLQRAQNTTSYNEHRTNWRVVCQRGGQSDARPLLCLLHWLPVRHYIAYKTLQSSSTRF